MKKETREERRIRRQAKYAEQNKDARVSKNKAEKVNCRGIMKELSPKYLREKARISERKLALAGAFGPVARAQAMAKAPTKK